MVWLYSRTDLMTPFLSLADRMDITAVFFNNKNEELPYENGQLFKRIYWSDFATPAKMLKQVNPDFIIFMGFASLRGVSLRIAAASRDIPCYMLEHGIKNDLTWIRNDHEQNVNNKTRFLLKNVFSKGLSFFSVLYFSFSCIGWKNRRLLPVFTKMAYAFIKYPPQIAMAKVRFIERIADRYFIFGPFMIKTFLEQSDIPAERFSVIGSIFYDDFFRRYHQAANESPFINEKYLLFVDQPIEGLDMPRKLSLFRSLRLKAAASEMKLVVKLHPNDYLSPLIEEEIVSNPDIIWIKAADTANLIHHAQACFGFFSTLLIPAISFKICFVFDFFNIPFVKEWTEMNVIVRLTSDDVGGIDLNAIDKYHINQADRKKFIDYYLFKTDGKAIERLADEIL